jgi:hypothetical protein
VPSVTDLAARQAELESPLTGELGFWLAVALVVMALVIYIAARCTAALMLWWSRRDRTLRGRRS